MLHTRFKQIMLLTWTLWWSIAFATDFLEALQRLGWFKLSWLSVNYPFLLTTLAKYGVPTIFAIVFYVGIILCLLIITILFWQVLLTPVHHSQWQTRVDRAFIVSLSLCFAFYLADQLVLDFTLEQNHMVQGSMLFISYLAFYILPNSTVQTNK